MNYDKELGNLDLCVDCMFSAEENPRLMADNFLTPNYDTETGEGFTEFSKSWCGVCNSRLAGNRFRYMVWGN
jgi:hypothetical protein